MSGTSFFFHEEMIAVSNMNFGENHLQLLKSELNEDLTKCVADSDEVWEELCAEQTICMQIVAKQIIVSDKFSYFHEMWMGRDANEETAEQLHRFTEVEEEVNQLHNDLRAFEIKVQKSSDTLRELNERLSFGLNVVDQIRNLITNSSDAHLLSTIQFPDFIRLKLKSPSYNDPVELNEEWDNMDIDNKITACLLQMDSIFNS